MSDASIHGEENGESTDVERISIHMENRCEEMENFCEGLEYVQEYFQQFCRCVSCSSLLCITLLFKIHGSCMCLVNECIGSFPNSPSIYFSPKKKLMRSVEIVHCK